jgi:hypothetical protein
MNNTKSLQYFSLYKMVALYNYFALSCSRNGGSVFIYCLPASVLVHAPLPITVVGENAHAITERKWR